MIRKWCLGIVFGAFFAILFFSFRKVESFRPHDALSAYGLFAGEMKRQIPADGVIPYDLNTPLFSDYAHKLRFVKIPAGKKARYSADEVFEFPEGTVIAKTFYYPEDFRKPEKKRRILETRILYRQESHWSAFSYIWNEEQTEATYEVAGAVKPVSWIHGDGKKRSINYVIPNQNQCKQCHELHGAVMPIGPTARSLNRDFTYPSGTHNQLEYWAQAAVLEGLPESASRPKLPVWNDASSGSLSSRARAYLDVNCGHCHRVGGQASTSGLVLTHAETDLTKLGVNKTPVAAGRASADMLYSIHPGKPEKSILIYRLQSLDPGVMMPEMGRRMVDKEGLSLLSEWIKGM
jgi:uncharacterized repeat protein (TIGR03806 family)